MPTLPLVLVLNLPPLSFGPGLIVPPAFEPPRELTCKIQDLGRIRLLPLLPSPTPHPAPLALGALHPRDPNHLVGPVTDGLLFLGLAVCASRTGGQVTSNAWPGQTSSCSSSFIPPGGSLPPPGPASNPQ